MTGYLHELRCRNDPCVCRVLYRVTGTERMSDNGAAEVAAEPHTLESRGPVVELPLSGRALRVTGGRR